jgi:hypothetical protein
MTQLPRPALAIAVAAFVAAAAGGGVAVAQAVGGSNDSGTSSSVFGYGSVPTWLPKAASRPDGVERGTVAHPALTTQGDVIHAVLPGNRGSVDVRVTGPEIPGEGFSYQPQFVTTTFMVTFSNATRAIPIAINRFTAYDSNGQVHSLSPLTGVPAPPRVVRPGQVAHFALRTVLPVGEGMLRWAPLDNDLLGTWDFVSEND